MKNLALATLFAFATLPLLGACGSAAVDEPTSDVGQQTLLCVSEGIHVANCTPKPVLPPRPPLTTPSVCTDFGTFSWNDGAPQCSTTGLNAVACTDAWTDFNALQAAGCETPGEVVFYDDQNKPFGDVYTWCPAGNYPQAKSHADYPCIAPAKNALHTQLVVWQPYNSGHPSGCTLVACSLPKPPPPIFHWP